jgi:hypothetical protein
MRARKRVRSRRQSCRTATPEPRGTRVHGLSRGGAGQAAGVEFSWEGNDESDPASGRGWAVLEEDGSLSGRIFFHLGDDSGFTAVREATEGRF